MGLFNNRKKTGDKTHIPVWFMRQAGRYHDHYQNIRSQHSFMEMCKDPSLACEITLGPIDEFHFDAAILFSDLLFPLEQLNFGLEYLPKPTLERQISSMESFDHLSVTVPAEKFYDFQKQALINLKEKLPPTVTLLGFVGAPFTLYTYACESGHKGNLTDAKKGLYDGRYQKFMELLIPELIKNMLVQAAGGPEVMCLFDTAVGELSLTDFKRFALPYIKNITSEFKKKHPEIKIIYYSKLTHLHYLKEIQDKNIDVLGVDWRIDLKEALQTLGKDYYIQGNLDPSLLHLPWEELKIHLENIWEELAPLGKKTLDKWIFGLGHGVLPKTPQENVKNAVKFIQERFIYE